MHGCRARGHAYIAAWPVIRFLGKNKLAGHPEKSSRLIWPSISYLLLLRPLVIVPFNK
jgi:hypothetical protein